MGVETSRLPTVAFARPSSGIAAESGVDVARRREIFGQNVVEIKTWSASSSSGDRSVDSVARAVLRASNVPVVTVDKP